MNLLKQHIFCTLFLLFIILLIFIIGAIRCKTHYDPLLHKFIGKVDGWMVSHFITFAFIGFYFPDTFIYAMILGVMWELIENMLGKFKPSRFKSFGFCIDDKQKLKGNFHGASWWYGQYEDVIADAIGFIFGKYLLQHINKK